MKIKKTTLAILGILLLSFLGSDSVASASLVSNFNTALNYIKGIPFNEINWAVIQRLLEEIFL